MYLTPLSNSYNPRSRLAGFGGAVPPIPRLAISSGARSRRRYRGFGDLNSEVNTASSIASSGAAATIGFLVYAGSIGGPLGAAIGAAAGLLIEVGGLIAKQFAGCGQTCVIASNDANQVGDLMTQNVQAYVSAPYSPDLQAAALNNFDTAWAALSQACSNSQLGDAGKRCISDRQRGACVWKASAGGWVVDASAPGGYRWTDYGPAGSGNVCWNYFVGMRDPIANDPRAQAYSASPGSGLLSDIGLNPSATIAGVPIGNLFLPAALLLGAALL